MKHLGIIPDGNRRWANLNNIDYYEGYVIGLKKILRIIEIASNENFSEFTVYLLSKENYKRSREDLDTVYKAEKEFIDMYLMDFSKEMKFRVNVYGDFKPLPLDFQHSIEKITRATNIFAINKQINLLIGYSPIDELLELYKKPNVNRDVFFDNLWVKKKVDLVIRTAGGKIPLSNFIPLQSGYAAIYITESFLNDLTDRELKDILIEFESMKLKNGK